MGKHVVRIETLGSTEEAHKAAKGTVHALRAAGHSVVTATVQHEAEAPVNVMPPVESVAASAPDASSTGDKS